MIDPLTFLTAALDAAQRDAEAANGRYWVDAEGDDDATAWVMNEDMHLFETDPATARHAANNSPQATLRRIAADRKMLALHADDGNGRCGVCYSVRLEGPDDDLWATEEPTDCPCTTVRLLAEGYGWTETEQR